MNLNENPRLAIAVQLYCANSNLIKTVPVTTQSDEMMILALKAADRFMELDRNTATENLTPNASQQQGNKKYLTIPKC